MASNTGTTVFPGSLDDYARVGTGTFEDDTGYGHVDVTNQAQEAVEAIEVTVGTNSGTGVLTNFTAGDLAAIQDGDTFGTPTLVAPTITGVGTVSGTIDSDFVVTDAKDIKFASGAKIERSAGDLKLTPETAKSVLLQIRRQGGAADNFNTVGTTSYTEPGVFMQFGAVQSSESASVTVTFPDIFVAGSEPVVFCQADSTTAKHVSVTAISNTTFGVSVWDDAGSRAAHACYWLAIGRK